MSNSNSPFAGGPISSSNNNNHMQGSFYGTPEKSTERSRSSSRPFDANTNGYEQGVQTFSPSPTRGKFPPYQTGYGQAGGYLSAANGAVGGGGAIGHPSAVGAGDGIQRSRSPNMGSAPGQGGIPNGRFLEINSNPHPGAFDGYSGNGASHQRIPTSPSSLGRTSDRAFGSIGSLESGPGLSSLGPAEGQTDGDAEQDEIARRSPRQENAFEGGRKLWNAQGQIQAGPNGPGAQIQGPGSLGGTPTRGVGGRPGVERSHSRFATAPTPSVAGQGQGTAGALGAGLNSGLDRPSSAMGIKGAAAGVVAGVTDSSGRMEGQALIVSRAASRISNESD